MTVSAKNERTTVAQVREMLACADGRELAALEQAFADDGRAGVARALETAKRRVEAQRKLEEHTRRLYRYQESLACGKSVAGLDEVGRGPLAGPLTVAAVALPESPLVLGLDDSKKLPAHKREELAARIHEVACAVCVHHVPPDEIDKLGMACCLRHAFSLASEGIAQADADVDVLLLDGNPLGFDAREVNVVKGDAKCASVAAASIVAKVERDALMVRLAQAYPLYGFERNKGYGTSEHLKAIQEHGLTPVHRTSFCQGILQKTLF